MPIQIGESIPNVQLTIASEQGPAPVASTDLLGAGRVVLFAVPGAFTPTCSAKHLPSYLEHHAALRARGVDRIVCMAVNDIFVLGAWAAASGVDGQVIMAADGNGEFTRALGLELDARAFGMGLRSQRFALILDHGVVTDVLVEGPGEYRVSSAEHVLERLS